MSGVARIPAGRVQLAALEAFQPRDGRPAHLGQRAGAADEEAGLDALRCSWAALRSTPWPLRVQRPQALSLVEARRRDRRAQPQVRAQPVLVGAAFHVGLDLGRGGKATAPTGVGLEAEAVQGCGHVHMGAGVAVVPPGAAEAVLLLQDEEVVQPGPLELDAQAQAGHAGTQDHHFMTKRRGVQGWRLDRTGCEPRGCRLAGGGVGWSCDGHGPIVATPRGL